MSTAEEWAIDAQMSERSGKGPKCISCGHPHGAWPGDCPVPFNGLPCGCTHFHSRAARVEGGRDWLVQAEFFVKNQWIKAEARVKASGPSGAIVKGFRECKRQAVKKRARVGQYKIVVTPMRGKGRSS